MNKRRKKKAAVKRGAEAAEAVKVLGGLPRCPKRLPRLTWRERSLTDTVDPRGVHGSTAV